ncbi:RidA family protein [Rhizobiales bacterium]|uniref:RidA family protein n=1 Tax=Hongsoonwoonella zoysiae TaxID=2821844 RepID=UPI00155FE956|nr:RidA family protein [Hongsoonwoonella zoysiae]NRG19025.1 RidA family protein [Hongsoonwoonella zoysiae]
MTIERFMVEGQLPPVSHYCHSVRAGNQVWVSGVVGMRADGTIPEDTVSQFDIAMDALDACLRAAGGRPEDIVKVQVFLTDISERAAINPRRQAYFGEHRPASTLVEVSALVDPRMKVEIECQAVLPEGR